ncbi:MAG: SPFH domain-containing protein [Pseudomonadota bacterium]
MDLETALAQIPISDTLLLSLSLIAVVLLIVTRGIVIVPQSQKAVIERFGKYRATLGPGPNLITPFIDRVAHRIDILERRIEDQPMDVITKDNAPIRVTVSTFFRITDPSLSIYRIRDVQGGIMTSVTGAVRSILGGVEFDTVQSNRAALSQELRETLDAMASEWGVDITRAEIVDVEVDQETRRAMLLQLNAERERRAAVAKAEGEKRAAELAADAELYAADKAAEARRLGAQAEADATRMVAMAIREGGLDALRYEVARKQIAAVEQMGRSPSSKFVVLPADLAQSFTGIAALGAGMLGKGDGPDAAPPLPPTPPRAGPSAPGGGPDAADSASDPAPVAGPWER